jgi:predicted DNA binding CopG/RHH family protein
MSEKIKYTDEPLGDLKVVPDFLPRPEELVFRDEGVKVTIALSKRSVEFFKGEARKHHTQYQRMIRRLLDAYAEHHSQPGPSRSTRTRAKMAGVSSHER